MDKEQILGFDVCTYSKKELLSNIVKDYLNGEKNFVVNINPEIIMTNYKNNKIKSEFNKQKYQIPDGSGVILASKRKKGKLKERITGIDLMLKICETMQEYPAKIFLYGSKKDIANKAKEELNIMYPKVNIVETCDGYCDESIAIEKINKSHADILFVGLGSPKQEKFIMENKDKLKSIKIFMPIGGSLDVISKTKKRAPKWMQKNNLEWLYRLIKEPKRIFRQCKLFKFIWLVTINKK